MGKKKTETPARFAIYTRYSSELQNDLSLEAQEQRCREEIAKRSGVVVGVYSDGAKSGWSLDRDGFIELRRAAEKGRFDAIMFWKFDRLARSHDHALMIKLLLRHAYGLKLYCVEGFSEDEDNSLNTTMMEQMLTVFSAFYSKNLSSETKRGKRQRAINGEFNGSIPPIGYDLITIAEAAAGGITPGLYLNPRLAAVVRRAFRMYATGRFSDGEIAGWMNSKRVIQRLRRGKQPVGKEMVRDMLQNKVYTGRVAYAETIYGGSLGEKRKNGRRRRTWFDGKHSPIISDALFEQCQHVRSGLRSVRQAPSVVHTYLLHDSVRCVQCLTTKPEGLMDDRYGKMRPLWDNRVNRGYYRCLAKERGYQKCSQPYVQANTIDAQVVKSISELAIPLNFKRQVEKVVNHKIEREKAQERLHEIEEIVKRIDFSWEHGFLTAEEYLEKRNTLKREVKSLQSSDAAEILEAADLLENFTAYWGDCTRSDNPEEAQKQLLHKIVDRVYVYNDDVIALSLHGDHMIVLEKSFSIPGEILDNLFEATKKA